MKQHKSCYYGNQCREKGSQTDRETPDLLAESMNKCFCSVGEQLSKKIPKKMNSFARSQILVNKSKFSFSPVNAEDLNKAMSKFKSSQGFGMDNISSFFLKKSMPILANGLCQIFNMSLSTGFYNSLVYNSLTAGKLIGWLLSTRMAHRVKTPIADQFRYCLLCLDYSRHFL